jgi:spermidine synthase
MRIRRPYSLELAYTREMMAGLLLRPDEGWPERILLIGLGAGSLAKFIHINLPNSRTTVVEIDPRLVNIAEQHFKLPVDPQRLKITIAEGSEYIATTRKRFDAIFVDGFGADGRPGPLDTASFYSNCRERLSKQGIMICNLLGRNRGFQASVNRIRTAYEQRCALFPSLDSGNAIAFGITGEPVNMLLSDMRERANALKSATGLDLRPTISRLEKSGLIKAGKLEI